MIKIEIKLFSTLPCFSIKNITIILPLINLTISQNQNKTKNIYKNIIYVVYNQNIKIFPFSFTLFFLLSSFYKS